MLRLQCFSLGDFGYKDALTCDIMPPWVAPGFLESRERVVCRADGVCVLGTCGATTKCQSYDVAADDAVPTHGKGCAY